MRVKVWRPNETVVFFTVESLAEPTFRNSVGGIEPPGYSLVSGQSEFLGVNTQVTDTCGKKTFLCLVVDTLASSMAVENFGEEFLLFFFSETSRLLASSFFGFPYFTLLLLLGLRSG